MKQFRSLNYLLGVCLVLLLIASTLVMACSPKSTSTSTSSVTSSTSTSTSKTTASTTTSATSTTAKTTTSTSSAVVRSVLTGPQGAPSKETPQYGGTMVMIFAKAMSNSGAPWKLLAGPNKMGGRFVTEYLTGVNINGQMVPQLATSWESDATKRTITFTLRQGVKFHDGTDFNAEAVKWNLEMHKKYNNSGAQNITSIDILDPYHIRITISTWDPLFLNNLFADAGSCIVSPTNAQKMIAAGKEDELARTPVGTGPFKLVSWTPDVGIKLTKFDGYWQKGLPYLDGVQINFNTDRVVGFASFMKGETQFLEGISGVNSKIAKDQGMTITRMCSAISGLSVDSKNEASPYADIRVRRAMAYALDNKTMVDTVFSGMFVPTNQMAMEGATGWDETIKGYPYNPAKAQELLAQVGYTPANPLKTKLTYTNVAEYTDLHTMVQGYFKKVGIDVTLSAVTDAVVTQQRTQPAPLNSMWETGISYNGIEFQYSATMGLLVNNANWWPSIWTPGDFQTLFKLMLPEEDFAKRTAYYKQLNKMAIDDYAVFCPIHPKFNFKAASNKLIDMGMGNNANEFLPETIWLKK